MNLKAARLFQKYEPLYEDKGRSNAWYYEMHLHYLHWPSFWEHWNGRFIMTAYNWKRNLCDLTLPENGYVVSQHA